MRPRSFEKEFSKALEECRYEQFPTRSFAYSSTDSSAPDPELSIVDDEGVQVIRLPWTWPKFKVPSGAGVDYIDYKRIHTQAQGILFGNPSWESYVKGKVREVTRALGIPPEFVDPLYELDAIVFHRPGSHFRVTERQVLTKVHTSLRSKMDGAFATMLIVLPSAFEGGEVHSSYAHRSTILDVSKGSIHNTSVIAWYADAVLDATKFTSGSPLVLSYSLTYPSPDISHSGRRKNYGGQALLVECLRGWREGKMTWYLPKIPMVAFTLANCYSTTDLGKGLEAMRGIDANIVRHVVRAAGSVGYAVCLGSVTRGPPSFKHYFYRRSYGHRIAGVVDLDTSNDGWFEDDIFVDELNVVPKYRCMYCNDQYAVGRGHNLMDCEKAAQENGTLQRSVVILFRNEERLSVSLSAHTHGWVIRKLEALSAMHGPSEITDLVVCSLLRRLPTSKDPIATNDGSDEEEVCWEVSQSLVTHALEWENLNLWNVAILHSNPQSEATIGLLATAYSTFGLRLIQSGMSQLIKGAQSLRTKINIVNSLASADGDASAELGDLRKLILQSYDTPLSEDLPTIADTIRKLGVKILDTSFLTTVLSGSCTFLSALAVLLTCHLIPPASAENEQGHALGRVTRQCLLAAFSRWNVFPDSPKPSQAEIKRRISSLAGICLLVPTNFDLCLRLVDAVQEGATYSTQIALAQALHETVSHLDPALDAEGHEQVSGIRGAIYNCISAAIQQTGDWNLSQDRTAARANIDEFVQLSLDIGQPQLCRSLFNSMAPETPCWRLLQLMQAIQKSINEITSTKDPTRIVLRETMRAVGEEAIKKWNDVAMPQAQPVQNSNTQHPNVWVERVMWLMRWCLRSGQSNLCVSLLRSVLQIPAAALADDPNNSAWAPAFFEPLMKRVTQLLKEEGKFAAMPNAFTAFFRIAISVYLARVLGPKTPKILPSDAPTGPIAVGCGECPNCKELHDFVNGTDRKPFQVSDVRKLRTHIEREISRAGIDDVEATTTIVNTRPYTLVVAKLPEILARMEWGTTQAKALVYVESFGFGEEKLKEVMGPEVYGDMLSALKGRQVFLMEGPAMQAMGAPNGARSASSTITESRKPLVPSSTIAGVKRKRTEDTN